MKKLYDAPKAELVEIDDVILASPPDDDIGECEGYVLPIM